MAHEISPKLQQSIAAIRTRTRTSGYQIKLQPGRTPGPLDSKLGGLPYWDLSKPFPTDARGEKMLLLAQINLDREQAAAPLPAGGMLQFFHSRDDVFGMDFDAPDQQTNFRVVYHPHIDAGVTQEQLIALDLPTCRQEEMADYSPVLREAAITLQPQEFYINTSCAGFHQIFQEIHGQPLRSLTQEEYLSLHEQLSGGGHSLLGWPYFVQYDPRPENSPYDTLLLQIDSDMIDGEDYVLWGDCGIGSFFINRQDLERQDFSRVFYTWDCC